MKRNTDTPESREFWANIDKAAEEVRTWPIHKRHGANVYSTRPNSDLTTQCNNLNRDE